MYDLFWHLLLWTDWILVAAVVQTSERMRNARRYKSRDTYILLPCLPCTAFLYGGP
jgi:hypothetical protein